MNEAKQKFEDDYLLGSIKQHDEYTFYLMPLAWWILNYNKYDPEYNPADWEKIFRDNILNVTEENTKGFFNAIQTDKVMLEDLKVVSPQLLPEYKKIFFFIDFDCKEFISAFYDVEIQEYLPDERWTGKFGDPLDYLPQEARFFFHTKFSDLC